MLIFVCGHFGDKVRIFEKKVLRIFGPKKRNNRRMRKIS
jgi:hypothetical protein